MTTSWQPENLNLSFHFFYCPIKKDLAKTERKKSESEGSESKIKTYIKTNQKQIRYSVIDHMKSHEMEMRTHILKTKT